MKIVGIGGGASNTSSSAAMFRTVVPRWQRHVARLFDPYRPELHYMRGPGPKSRDKDRL